MLQNVCGKIDVTRSVHMFVSNESSVNSLCPCCSVILRQLPRQKRKNYYYCGYCQNCVLCKQKYNICSLYVFAQLISAQYLSIDLSLIV